MPSKSPAQAKLMRAVAHGWKPSRTKGPPVSVAKEFVAADRLAEMYEGGLAPMNDIIQRGFAPGLNMQEGGEVWTPYGPGQDYGDLEPLTEDALKFLDWDLTKGGGPYVKMMRKAQAQLREKYGIPDPANGEPTAMAPPTVPTITSSGPRGGGPRGGGGRRGRNGGGRRNGGGGGGGGDGPGPIPDETCPSGFRRRGGVCVPVGGGPPGVEEPPPGPPPVPRDPRAGRDTPMSEQLRAHRERVAASLAVPAGGYAEGGHVENYQEGGAARPGHAEGANPYPHGTARYNYWETRHHKEPPPPPVAEAEAEDPSWWQKLTGYGTPDRTEEELEKMEEAYGGYINAPGYEYGGYVGDGYQFGGLAAANFRRPPTGGVPPSISMPPQGGGYGATTSPVGPQQPPWRGAPPPRIQPGGGGGMPPWKGGPRRMVPPSMPPGGGFPGGGRGGFPGRGVPGRGFPGRGRRPGGANPYMPDGGGRMPFRGRDPRAMPPQGGAGPMGGPNVQPNMRGMLQKMRMQNRPPANVGGGANRVGMQDQQGGLARALQRGTGRRPMSRRGGFPGGGMRQ